MWYIYIYIRMYVADIFIMADVNKVLYYFKLDIYTLVYNHVVQRHAFRTAKIQVEHFESYE